MVEQHTSDGERSSRTREMGGGSAFPSSQFDCSRGTCNLYVSTCASSNRAIDLGRDWTLPLRFNQLGHLYWSSCYTVCRVVVAVGRSVGWWRRQTNPTLWTRWWESTHKSSAIRLAAVQILIAHKPFSRRYALRRTPKTDDTFWQDVSVCVCVWEYGRTFCFASREHVA